MRRFLWLTALLAAVTLLSINISTYVTASDQALQTQEAASQAQDLSQPLEPTTQAQDASQAQESSDQTQGADEVQNTAPASDTNQPQEATSPSVTSGAGDAAIEDSNKADSNTSDNDAAGNLKDHDKAYILSLVNPVEVDAAVNNSCRFYSDKALKKYVKTLAKGERVVFLMDKTQKTAYIKLKSGQKGWISYKYLTIPENFRLNTESITNVEKKLFVDYKGYDSSTRYLIWVNVERQQVNVFTGSKGKWDLVKTLACSSGKNDTPTINGEFTYTSLYKKRILKDGIVYNFMRYYDSFAIHSIPFNYNNTVNDPTLGEPRSHGCIRVSVEDSKWLAQKIPFKTKVVIN